jgi:hypothetical protein
MNPIQSIYDATTPAELRAAVVALCAAAINEARYFAGSSLSSQCVAEDMVPPVPPVWRVVTLSGHSYRCVAGVVEYRQGDGEWRETVWVHGRHLAVIADLIANPCEEVSA